MTNTTTTTTATTPVEDKEGPEGQGELGKKGEAEIEEPDWNLFHALQSTRGAMGDLRESARNPPPEETFDLKVMGLGQGQGDVQSIPRLSVHGSSTGTRTPGSRNDTLPDSGVHRALMIARAEGR